jgi:hypothetical protein
MIKISVPGVDGSSQDWTETDGVYSRYLKLRSSGYKGKSLVHELLTDDWGAPPVGVRLTGTLEDGTPVDEYIPYS